MNTRLPRKDSSRSSKWAPPTSPYLRALPPETDVEEDPLQLRLDFHRESVILHDYAGDIVKTKLVSALDVAHALARELDLSTGILPADTVWWSRTSTGVRVAVWREPRVWTVRLRESYDAKPRRLRLPMPGLVFVCLPARQAPYVFAAAARPRSVDDQLFHMPAYNVFTSGRICAGTHAFPADPARIPEEFFRSYFSATADLARGKSRRHADDIGRVWDELAGASTYPVDDLVPQLHVGEALRIGA